MKVIIPSSSLYHMDRAKLLLTQFFALHGFTTTLLWHRNCQVRLFIKIRYCEKATKFERISHLLLKLLNNVKTKRGIFSNLCGLLRLSELYGR